MLIADTAIAQSPDVQFCYRTIDTLNSLERNAYARNELKRDFEKDIERRCNIQCSLIALILPAIIWIYALNHGGGLLHQGIANQIIGSSVARIFGLFIGTAMLYVLAFLPCRMLWKSQALLDFRMNVERSLISKYQAQRRAINERSEQLLATDELRGERIPAKFLSIPAITLLPHYFQMGQATFLDAAVYMLELDLDSQAHKANIIPRATLVDKERVYLDKYWANLNKRVEWTLE